VPDGETVTLSSISLSIIYLSVIPYIPCQLLLSLLCIISIIFCTVGPENEVKWIFQGHITICWQVFVDLGFMTKDNYLP
jgi:hypothetical protein